MTDATPTGKEAELAEDILADVLSEVIPENQPWPDARRMDVLRNAIAHRAHAHAAQAVERDRVKHEVKLRALMAIEGYDTAAIDRTLAALRAGQPGQAQ